MNQILFVENNKGKKGKNKVKSNGPMEIGKAAKIFAILILLFGLIMLGQGIYSMVTKNTQKESNTKPVVTMAQDAGKLKISIKHDKAIDNMIYNWNEEETITLQGKGRNEIEESINLKSGTNTINLKVTDVFGSSNTYTQTIETPEGDITPPEIEFIQDDPKIKISVKDETALSYIAYRWNEEEETRLEAREDSPKILEEKVTVLKGTNTLTVIAVDVAGNKSEKSEVYKGAKKPTVELSRDGNNLVMKITDEENIQKIEYVLNGQKYSTDSAGTGTALNMKEITLTQALAQGANKFTVTAYNVNGQQESKEGEVTVE